MIAAARMAVIMFFRGYTWLSITVVGRTSATDVIRGYLYSGIRVTTQVGI
jgi:hypothetical protein